MNYRVHNAIEELHWMVKDGFTFSYALDYVTANLTVSERLEVITKS